MEDVILWLAIELLKMIVGALVKCLVGQAIEDARARRRAPKAGKHFKRP